MTIEYKPIGSTVWVVADGFIPPGSTATEASMISHDSICMLNAGDRPANVEVFVYYTDREPVGPYPIRIEPRRAYHQQINTIKGQEAVPSGTDYCLVIRSDEPIVAQHTRLDSRQEALALMTTIAYPSN